ERRGNRLAEPRTVRLGGDRDVREEDREGPGGLRGLADLRLRGGDGRPDCRPPVRRSGRPGAARGGHGYLLCLPAASRGHHSPPDSQDLRGDSGAGKVLSIGRYTMILRGLVLLSTLAMLA